MLETAHCSDYVQAECDTLLHHPAHLCNSCPKKGLCCYERRIYDAQTADKEYRDALVNSRSGFDLTAGQLRQIDEIISPLVKKGQSVYHIMQNNKEELSVSESTIRRLINASELEVRSIDLPEAVKRKPRRKPQAHPEPPASKNGHLYADYLSCIQQHDIPTVQMDCIEGKKTDRAVILTLYFVIFHMQLSFLLEEHSAACVVEMLDRIERSLGKELFAACFPLILTDNGHEFTDIKGMERSVFSGKRTKVFFCGPNRSDEKGGCENNHKLIRDIIPKGSSVQHFVQADMTLLTNHINSYSRKSLFGKCPYALAMNAIPEDFFVLLGLEKIPAKDVELTPKLLKHL